MNIPSKTREIQNAQLYKYLAVIILSFTLFVTGVLIHEPLTAEAKFTVYFNGNGGNTPSPSSKTITSGTAIGALPTVTRTGYNFKAFFTTSAASGGSQVWTTTKFTKVVARTHRVVSGDTLWDLAGRYLGDSTKYPTLASWNKIASNATLSLGQVLYVSNPALAKSTATYYARWEIASYTFSFNGNGGANRPSITKNYNSAVGTLPTSSWGSRTFNGWYTAKTGGTKLTTSTKMTATRTYYAQWTPFKHTVTYALNGGTGTFPNQTKTTGIAMKVHGAPTRSGYKFTGWKNSKDGKIYAAGANYPNDYNGGTVTMTAQWTPWVHTVNYNLNYGAGTATAQTKTTGVALKLHGAPTRSGYTFAGWKSSLNNVTYAASANYTSDYNGGTATMVAQWTSNTYTVTYNANGGTGAPATQSFLFNTGAKISTTKPTRSLHTFRHWTYTTNVFEPGAAIPSGWGSFSLTAQWAPYKHTVKYNLNGGTGTATTQTKTAGVAMKVHGTPTRAGHTFTGWKSSRNNVTYAAGASYTPDYDGGETTMTAQWVINRTVTFNPNGGTAPNPATKSLTNGSKVGTLPATTRSGYTFLGWFTAASGGTAISTSTTVTANVIYYAQWRANNFTFTFNANGGKTPSSASITKPYNTAIGTLPTILRDGHSFAGWWTTSAASGGTQLTTATVVTSNAIYYARWTINSYTFSFNGNGGTNATAIKKTYGSQVGTMPTSTRTGYTFSGWFNTANATGGTQLTATTAITGNVVYYARWTINQYTATFNANGGIAATPATIRKNYNTQLGTLPTTTRSGYYFNGWYTAASGGTKIATTTVITNNVTYYAQWLQNRTVTFNANGGNAPNIASKIVPNGHQIGTLATISRTGHTFNGWFTATTAGTQLATTTVITSNITYYARWSANNYTVTFNPNGGNTPSPTTITKAYGLQLGTLPTVSRSGYTFNGWYTATSGGTKVATTTIMTGTRTYYAQWTINRTVLFNANGGTAPSFASRVLTSGTAFGSLPTTSRTGYTFNGWFTATTAGTKLATTTIINSSLTYYAQWTINTYKFTFNANGGVAATPASITKNYNTAVGTLPTTTRTMYTFNGWFTATSGGTKLATTTLVTANTIYYAQWTPNTYQVRYNANGGTGAPATQNFVYNSGAKISTTKPTRTGYTFRHWTPAHATSTTMAPGAAIPSGWGSFDLVAQWSINSYTFSFNGNGGSNATAVTKTYNSQVGTLPTSTRSGYTFRGWFTTNAATGGTQLTTSTLMAANTTYYARWTINRTVTFNANGGGTPSVTSRVLMDGTAYGTLPTISRTGYTFKGWWTDAAASGGTQLATTTVITSNVAYYARWTINNYTVTWDGNGGTTPAVTKKNYNTAVGTLPTTTRTGHTFTGWFTAKTAGTKIATSTIVTNNITYYAQWTINSYTVNFQSNGGNAIASKTYTYNTQLGTLPVSTRTGYTFNGWYTAASSGTKIATTTLVTANITYHGQWTINQYTATFNGNGGSNGTAIKKDYNSQLGTLPTSTRSGYYFNGWFTTTTGGTQILTSTKLTANVTYYAQWLQNRTVTFNQNGGNAPSFASKVVPTTHKVGDLPTVTRTGHSFTGWYTAASGGTKIDVNTVINANIIYYAQWTANNYTATFNGNGGTNGASITKLYNTAIGTLPTSTRSGFYFNGWFTAKTGGTKIATTTKLTTNVTYYAQWLQNRTVTYNANGGNAPSFATKVVPTTHTVGTLPTITRTGHTFNGWFTAATGGTKIATNTVVSADVIFYAQWTINEFTVTWNGGGGTTPASKILPYGAKVGTLPSTTRSGYTFLGWFTAATGGTKISANTTVTTNVTFYAQWVINRTVTFNSQGGSAVASKTVTNGTVLSSLTTPTRTGYTFNGWFTAQTGGTKVVSPLTVNADMNLHAQWTINNYTVTFNSNGGTTVASKGYPYNTAVGTLPTPTRTGYTLNGWYTAATGGTKIATSTLVTNNVTYYAQWTINTYTATFNSQGGSAVAAITKNYKSQLGTLPVSTRTGYTLNGWFTTRTGGTQISTTTLLTNNVTYHAQWTAINYTVTWDVQSGVGVNATVVAYDTAVGTLPTTTRSGYHFEGWFTAVNGGGAKVTTSTKVYGNVTYYAYWIINRTVTFNANSGTTPSFASKVVVHNRAIGALPTTTRTGYTFKGWFTGRSSGTKLETTTLITSNITYYANWTPIKYTITWDVQGGVAIASQQKDYDSALGTLPVPTRSGYTFLGWYTGTNGVGTKIDNRTMVKGNVTYYANWVINRTVTYNVHGGTAVTNVTVTDKTVIPTLPVTTKTGYTFLGWFTAQTGGTKVGEPLTVNANMNLHAQWRVNDYLVTYDAQGGSTVANAWHTYNTQIGTLPTTTRTGYTFNGWFTAKTGGTKIATSTLVTNNVTYYAQWTINTYDVTWDTNGGDAVPVSRVDYAKEVGTLPVTNRVGHTLDGWYTTRSGGTMITTATKIYGATTFYARWTPVTYTVTFNVQGGSAVTPYKIKYNTAVGTLPETTKAGHHFEGWFTAVNGGGAKVTAGTRIYGNTTYYAYWIENRVVTFNANSGTAPSPSSKTIVHGRVLGTLPTTTRKGYTFNGWFTTRTGGTKATEATLITADIIYYAQWTPLKYTITFDAQGGSAVTAQTHAHDSKLGTLPTTTRSGYHFEGWFTVANGAGSQISDKTTVAGPVTYYAYWIINRTVVFDLNGGTTQSMTSKVVPHGKAFGTLPTATRTGHTFNGWFTGKTNGTKLAATTLITSDITYYAQWTPITYTVRFDPVGGLGVADRKVVYNTEIGALPHTARMGYVFRGWWTAAEGGSEINNRTRVYGNTTYYARWDDHANLTFNQNGGRFGLVAMRVPVGTTIPQLREMIKAHDFNLGRLVHSSKVLSNILVEEESTLNNALLVGGQSFAITQDVTATLQWSDTVLLDITTGSAVNYKDFTKFTHTTTGGVTGSRTLVESGKTIKQLTLNLTKTGIPITSLGTKNSIVMDIEGYNIDGYKNTATNVVYDKKLDDSLDINLWGTRSHVIDTLNGKGSPRVMMEANISRIELAVKFDAQGGVAVPDAMVYYGDAMAKLPTTTRTHYDLQGWFTEPNGKGTKLTTSYIFKAPATYYAHWTPKNYVIKFDSQGGTAVANRTVVYNNKLGTMPTPTRAGYLLLGWYTQKEGMGTQITANTVINGNFTYYAHWTDTVQVTIRGTDNIIAPLNVKIGTTFKQLEDLILSRNDVLLKLTKGGQYAEGFSMVDSKTGVVIGNLRDKPQQVITNHMQANVLWGDLVNYYLTTGPDVNNKPFDSITMSAGNNLAVSSYKPVKQGTKSGTLMLVNTTVTGSPIRNLGSTAKINPYIEGYEITGWKNKVTGVTYGANLNDEIDTNYFKSVDAIKARLQRNPLQVELEAQLRRISYKVKFDATGGSNVATQEIYHGAKLLNITVPTRSKYVFKGWYTQPGGQGEQLTLDTVIKSNRTYYAHWNEILNITFETQGGSGPIPARNFESGNAVGTLPLTSLTKHRFAGWYTQPGGAGERVTAARVPTKDEVYYAQWIEQMTVIIKDGQTELNRFTIDNGTKVPYFPTVTRPGYTFLGWVTADGDTYITTDTPITRDMTVTAKFERNITVKFDTLGGTKVPDISMLSGDALPNLPEPTREDYNFSGWYTQPGGKGPMYREGVPVYDDLTLYANWTDDEFRITFDTRGGTPAEHILVMKGGSVGLDGRTEREGYRFMGWYTEPEYTNKVSNLYTPTRSIKLYARWEIIRIHEVQFNTNSELKIAPFYIKENTAIEKMPAPKREGYGFLGWYLDAGLNTQVYEGYMPLQDLTLHAKWVKQAEIINITFDEANGKAKRTYQSVKGHQLPASYYQTPVREGYRFKGWFADGKQVNEYTVYNKETNVVGTWEKRGNYDEGKYPNNPALVPNLNPKPWVPTPYLDPPSKPVGELVQEQIITSEGIKISEANDWLKVVTKVTLSTGTQKQVIYGDE